jgi:hypothetical protein
MMSWFPLWGLSSRSPVWLLPCPLFVVVMACFRYVPISTKRTRLGDKGRCGGPSDEEALSLIDLQSRIGMATRFLYSPPNARLDLDGLHHWAAHVPTNSDDFLITRRGYTPPESASALFVPSSETAFVTFSSRRHLGIDCLLNSSFIPKVPVAAIQRRL